MAAVSVSWLQAAVLSFSIRLNLSVSHKEEKQVKNKLCLARIPTHGLPNKL